MRAPAAVLQLAVALLLLLLLVVVVLLAVAVVVEPPAPLALPPPSVARLSTLKTPLMPPPSASEQLLAWDGRSKRRVAVVGESLLRV